MNDCTLEPLEFPLYGSRLIEASAGTGKTWTIAALYVRLILGHGAPDTAFQNGQPLAPQQILVLTFTRAATRELTERIRARLTQAARVFRGEIEAPQDDPFLRDLLAEYHAQGEAATQQAGWRLALAAEAMDEAAVHTIDAWCQRMLREHALDCGQTFDDEFGDDEETLRQEAVRDYWRQQVYALDEAAFAALASLWGDVETLEDALAPLRDAHLPQAAGLEGQTLAEVLAPLVASMQQCKECIQDADWVAHAQQMRAWLDKGRWNGQKLRADWYHGWLDKLTAWARAPKNLPNKKDINNFAKLAPDNLRTLWKGAGECPEPPAVFHELAALVEAMCAQGEAQQAVATPLRLHAAVHVQARLDALKRRARTFGFHDAQRRLNNALHDAEHGERLRQRILNQTPVALIDEFQDTSPEQYAIFNALYRTQENDADTALLLIGDPKQSIYAFRGADIYSYLAARRATAGRHYRLNTNYRSTAAMVEAVNGWFALGEKAREAGAFRFHEAAENPLPFFPVDARGLRETLRTRTDAVPPCTLACWRGEALNKEDCRERFAEHCAAQIVAWLNDEGCGFYGEEASTFRRLLPADIAILVHDFREADAMRRALRARGLPSVYLSERESVFASAEAADLLYWLRAVVAPQDGTQVRTALASSLFARNLSELAQLADDDATFEAHSEALQALRTVWQRQGVLAMLRQTLHRFALPARWLAATDGNGERRLTNFLHLSELLQNAAAELDGEDALIHWLQAQCHAPQGDSEAQTIRLESDAGLIRIITIHKSKGLEYPVVCLPFSARLPHAQRGETPTLVDHDERGQLTVRLNPEDDEVQRIALDERREGLRLFYVALTRARHAVWLGFAPLTYYGKPADMSNTAPGYLLGGDGWQAGIAQLTQETPGIRLLPLTAEDAPAPTRAHAPQADAPLCAAPEYRAEFERNWQIGSFSALTRGLHDALPLHPPRRAADEQTTEARARASAVVTAAADWHHLPRGPALGNLLHEQLEWLAQEGFARTPEDLVRRLRRSACAEHAEALAHWLHAIVQQTPLAPLGGATLGSLRQYLPEMEFWLPARAFSAETIDALCQRYLFPNQPRPALARRQLHGMLMGFADLVLEHDGRYWVLDYKSNHLGENGAAYTEAALADAMLAHRYDVQAALYLLATHRLLRARLGEAYQPAQQLGGALYLFARGIDGPTRGLCALPADANLLALLDEMEALA